MGDNSDTNVKIDISANADGVRSGVTSANSELGKLNKSVEEMDKKYVAATASSEKLVNVTNRTAQQFVTLGKEVASGDTGRIPETLARIAFGFGPIGIVVGTVTAAIGAGVWAWMNWGDEAEKSMQKVSAALADSEKDLAAAERGIRKTFEEKLADLDIQKQIAEGALNAARWEFDRVTRETDSKEAVRIGTMLHNRRDTVTALDRQIIDLKKLIDEADAEAARKQTTADKKANKSAEFDPEGDFFDAVEVAHRKKLRDEDKKSEIEWANAAKEANRILDDIDPIHKANTEWQKLLDLHDKNLLSWEEMGSAYAKAMGGLPKETKKTADSMSKTWDAFRDNTQRILGDQLFDGMMGKFNSLEDALKQMFMRIAANAAAANITDKLFGGKGSDGSTTTGLIGAIGSWFSSANGNAFGSSGVVPFANGGAFGDGMVLDRPTPFMFADGGTFKPGVAGEAGYEGAMPLKRMSNGKLGVYSEGGGGGFIDQSTTTIHIDSSADRAKMLADVNRLIDSKQAKFRESMKRGTV